MPNHKFEWDMNTDIVIDSPSAVASFVPEPVLDPRAPKYKRLLIKTIFAGDEALYNEFLGLYDAAVARGSGIPYDAAMVAFRDRYAERPDGTWAKR